jgi:hypothetical protein
LARPGWVTAMEAIKNAVSIANWYLFRAITDGNRYSRALTASINPNPAVWEIVFNGIANQVLQDLNE